jgi:hypothetical protein
MCIDPATLGLIGTAVSAFGQVAAGQAANASAQAQAKAYEQQAEAERRSAAYELAQTQRQQEQEQAAARAAIGASGVGFAGSPTEVLKANRGQQQLDLDAIRYGSQLKQNSLTTQADISRMEGRNARTASFINATSTVIGGAVKFGQNPFR